MAIKREVSKFEVGCEVVDGNQYGIDRQLFVVTSHVGLVLETGEYNGAHDSDFYAVVWNLELGQPERIVYASTCGWCQLNSAQVDARPEIQVAYKAFLDARYAAAQAQAKAEADARPAIGKVVRVVRGRKVPKGTEAQVFWVGTSYNQWSHRNETRVGIVMANGNKEFVLMEYLEVIG